jgi:hypothetical protein
MRQQRVGEGPAEYFQISRYAFGRCKYGVDIIAKIGVLSVSSTSDVYVARSYIGAGRLNRVSSVVPG